jgi:hypothetical protein
MSTALSSITHSAWPIAGAQKRSDGFALQIAPQPGPNGTCLPGQYLKWTTCFYPGNGVSSVVPGGPTLPPPLTLGPFTYSSLLPGPWEHLNLCPCFRQSHWGQVPLCKGDEQHQTSCSARPQASLHGPQWGGHSGPHFQWKLHRHEQH